MELRQLRFVVTLAEELHFRRAAERMHIAQPAFSEQIRRLELELQARLFDRTSHYVRLTEAGRLFLDEVRAALEQLDRAASIAAQAGRGELGSVAVGFVGSAANELTAPILRTFAERYPTVAVTLRQFSFGDPSAGLAARESDVAFVRPPVEQQHELALEVLFEEPRVAALPDGHPLAGEPCLSIRQLLDEPFVVAPRSAGVWRDFWREGRGASPSRIGPEARTTDEWLELIASGRGVTLAPASTERFYGRPGVRFVPVTDVDGSAVAVARRRETVSPVVAAFVDVAIEVARDRVPPAVTDALAARLPGGSMAAGR